MSSSQLLLEPLAVEERDWIELDEEISPEQADGIEIGDAGGDLVELEPVERRGSDVDRVQLRGHGRDHHGVLPSGSLVDAGPDPSPVPLEEGWDF
jgi:hypothetical protein